MSYEAVAATLLRATPGGWAELSAFTSVRSFVELPAQLRVVNGSRRRAESDHLSLLCSELRALESAGMFAFVLIDHRPDAPDGALVAARDPTGIKPLYYGVDETGAPVAFASELKVRRPWSLRDCGAMAAWSPRCSARGRWLRGRSLIPISWSSLI